MNKRVVFIVAVSLVAGVAIVAFVVMGAQRGRSSLKGSHQIHDQQMSVVPTNVQSSTQHAANQSEKISELLAVFRSTDSSEKARSEALGKLYALRMEMTDEELQSLWAGLLDVAKEQGLSAQFHSDELWVLNEIGLLLKHKGLLSAEEIEAQLGFLIDLSADDEQNLSVRRMAITVLGDLKVANAVPMLSDLLEDEQNWNTPELARSAAIALSRLDSEQALKPVAKVLSATTNSTVFDSAAYAMREMDSPEVLAVLASNRHRLGDNLSVDNTITELFPVLTNVLANPSSPHISSAIDATQSIWQEDQRKTVIQQLEAIVQNGTASSAVRQQALDRLLDISKILHREERQELLARLTAITTDPQFSEIQKKIQRERGIRTLAPKER